MKSQQKQMIIRLTIMMFKWSSSQFSEITNLFSCKERKLLIVKDTKL